MRMDDREKNALKSLGGCITGDEVFWHLCKQKDDGGWMALNFVQANWWINEW